MSQNLLAQVIGLASVLVIGALALGAIRLRRAAGPTPLRAGEARRFTRALDHVLDRADEPPPAAPEVPEEVPFHAAAEARLEPLLAAFVGQAADHGRRASYAQEGAGDAATWRLQVDGPELPDGRFPPYIAFSAGTERDVAVIYGGVFPAPADHNGADAEIGWREIDWEDVDKALLHFAERTFHRWGHIPREAEAS